LQGVKITTLVDDYCFRGKLLGEHGLAILLETLHGKVLFDTGQGMVLRHNILTLNVNFSDISAIAISHGHNDHTGGLKEALAIIGADEMPVYAHEGIFRQRKKENERGELVPTGIPFGKEELESLGASFRFNSGPEEIIKGITITGPIERGFKETKTKSHFILDKGELVEDPFDDDQALIVETGRGIVVVLGCAHAGVINTLNHVEKITGEKYFYALFGGTHLLQADKQQLESTLREIERRRIEVLGFSHCTGVRSCAYFAENFSGKYNQGDTGFSIEI